MDENQPQISNWSRVAVGWTFKILFQVGIGGTEFYQVSVIRRFKDRYPS